MVRSLQGRIRRKENVQARIKSIEGDHFKLCVVLGCGRPTSRANCTGLSGTLCRKHLMFRQRHGSVIYRSPSAKLLRPFTLAAIRMVLTKTDDPFIKAALQELGHLMDTAGPVVLSTRLKGLSAKRRAAVVLARLRKRSVDPSRLLAIVLGLHAFMRDRPELSIRMKEWRQCAISKATHRLAGGDHKVWELREDSGRLVGRTEMHSYPRSAGRVLRVLGEAIERPCEWVIEKHLQNVIVHRP